VERPPPSRATIEPFPHPAECIPSPWVETAYSHFPAAHSYSGLMRHWKERGARMAILRRGGFLAHVEPTCRPVGQLTIGSFPG
jgi:hypothetical protein